MSLARVASRVMDVTANSCTCGTREGLVSLVAVLTSLYPGATVAVARVVVKERPSVHQIVGLSLAPAGMASIASG